MKSNNPFFLQGNNNTCILLIHGLNTGSLEMTPMARYLNDYGYSVNCVNVAGHGTYPQDLLHTNMEDFIYKAEYDYERTKKNFDKVFVGGVSTGGLLSLYLSAKHPEISGAAVMSAPLKMIKNTFFTADYPKGQVYFHRPMEGLTGLNVQYHIHYEDIAIRIFHELDRLIDIVKEKDFLKQITVPSIVIQAKDDGIAEPASAKQIYDGISSQKKELYTPDYGTHDIMLTEARYEAFRRTANFFLKCNE
jgi:carboxylesterase